MLFCFSPDTGRDDGQVHVTVISVTISYFVVNENCQQHNRWSIERMTSSWPQFTGASEFTAVTGLVGTQGRTTL